DYARHKIFRFINSVALAAAPADQEAASPDAVAHRRLLADGRTPHEPAPSDAKGGCRRASSTEGFPRTAASQYSAPPRDSLAAARRTPRPARIPGAPSRAQSAYRPACRRIPARARPSRARSQACRETSPPKEIAARKCLETPRREGEG